MNTKEYLLAEIAKRLAECKAITDKADKEARDLTEDEGSEIKAKMGRIEEHKVEVKRMEDREALNAQLEALGTVTHVATSEPVKVQAKSIGDAFVQSTEYRSIVEMAKDGGLPEFEMPMVELKAAGDPTLESAGTNDDAIAPTWFGLEQTGFVQWRDLVQSVLNTVQIANGNTANYPVVSARSIESQAATAEGAAKKGATFGFDYESKQVLKWTAFGGASEEMFEDAPTLANYINTELGFMALQSEEAAVVAALYAQASDTVDGTGVQTSPTAYDMIREGIATINMAGGTANVLLINPMDAAVLDTTQASGIGYYSGGPYQAAATGLWGSIRRVETPAVDVGSPILGDFTRGCRLFRKGGLRVASSNSHGDYFQKNLIAVRGEIRSILGVTYPEFFLTVELGTS